MRNRLAKAHTVEEIAAAVKLAKQYGKGGGAVVHELDEGNAAGTAQVKAHAEAHVGRMLDQLDAQLASHGQAWLLGPGFSAVDPYALMLCRWTRGFARPARSLPHLAPYLQRVLARPAVQRAFATEKLQPPLV